MSKDRSADAIEAIDGVSSLLCHIGIDEFGTPLVQQLDLINGTLRHMHEDEEGTLLSVLARIATALERIADNTPGL